MYFAVLFALPFGFLASTSGTIVGLGLFCLILLYLKLTAKKRLIERLRLVKLYSINHPGLFASLSSFTERINIGLPEVFMLNSPGLNLGVFALSKSQSLLFLSKGLIDSLSREELAALLARAVVELKTADLKNRSWLSQFLLLIERPTTMDFIQNRSHTRRFYPISVFLRQLILYPLCWLPIQLIGIKQNSLELDESSISLTGDRRSLSEAYRNLEAYRQRTPVFIPFAFHSLFLLSPESIDPLAKVFVRSQSLTQRIYQLEGRQFT